jgi:hypothetical protein
MRRAIVLVAGLLLGCEAEPPDLYAPPPPLVKFDRIPEPPKPPPPKTPPPRMSPEDAARLLDKIFQLYQRSLAEPGGCVQGDPELYWEMKRYFLEARLFARAHPKIAQQFALRILEDGDAEEAELRFVVEFLRPLNRQLDRRVVEMIGELADHPDGLISSFAIAVLGSFNRASEFRYPLWSHCAKGRQAAFDMLSYDEHPDTRQFLEELKGRCPVLCDEALSRLKILRSPDWKARVEELLRFEHCREYYWAKGVASKRLPDVLRRALRRQLDECRKSYEPQLTDGEFAYRFVHAIDVPGTGEYFERLLTDFHALGGELTPIEAQRLHHFGFLGDPEERLLEILRRRGHRW